VPAGEAYIRPAAAVVFSLASVSVRPSVNHRRLVMLQLLLLLLAGRPVMLKDRKCLAMDVDSRHETKADCCTCWLSVFAFSLCCAASP